MPQFNFDGPCSTSSLTRRTAAADSIRRSILEAYGWMTAGLAVTGLTAFTAAKSGILTWILTQMPVLFFGILIGQLVLTLAFTFMRNKVSAGMLRALFLVFAFAMGITLSSLFSIPGADAYTGTGYTDTTLLTAFLISAVYFGCLVFIGMTTKNDMSKIGTVCLTGLAAMLITQLILFLFGAGMSVRLFSIVGLVLFTGLTARDVQRLNQTMIMCDGQPVEQKKWAVFFALTLYLDFINIFLKILSLLGSGGSSRK